MSEAQQTESREIGRSGSRDDVANLQETIPMKKRSGRIKELVAFVAYSNFIQGLFYVDVEYLFDIAEGMKINVTLALDFPDALARDRLGYVGLASLRISRRIFACHHRQRQQSALMFLDAS